ncbi:sialic acid-binding Ig-like lectin 10 [Tenrec ecaudatus]|uniref:sialic acid-binding Ig-like lectin 10 n=1 Tax=Tenrec ecaudatus TaxID=94439 RepID=UPI003F5A3102
MQQLLRLRKQAKKNLETKIDKYTELFKTQGLPMFLLLLLPLLLLPLPLLGQGFWVRNSRFKLQISKTVTRDWNQSTPALGYWFRDGSSYVKDPPVTTNDPMRKAQEETRDRFHLTGDPRNYSCSMDITDARMTDVGSYFFRIVRGTYVKYNYKYDQLYVNVTEPAHNGTNLTCRVTFPGANVTTESTIQLIVSWNPSSGSEVIEGIAWGVGVTILLALCLCLIFCIMKIRKKKSAEKTPHTNDVQPALDTSPQGHLYESWSGSPTDDPPPTTAVPTVKDEQELHYASVTFQEPQSRSSEHIKEQETPSTTEYSEIRLTKTPVTRGFMVSLLHQGLLPLSADPEGPLCTQANLTTLFHHRSKPAQGSPGPQPRAVAWHPKPYKGDVPRSRGPAWQHSRPAPFLALEIMWLMMALPLLWLDMIQDPEIQTPDLIVAGEPITLMCVVPGICLDSKALSIIWKGPAVSSVSSDHFIVAANASSSVIRFTPRPEDHGTTLECHLNFFPTNSTKRTAIVLSIHSPAKLMHFSCTKKKTMLCTCAFHGFPMPTFQWFLGEVPVGVESMHNIFQVVYNMLEPWANSTIGLRGDPETLQKLHCEGKNIYGTHSSRIFLRPNRVSSTELFYRGLIQGIVFGLIGTSLLFLCLILFL